MQSSRRMLRLWYPHELCSTEQALRARPTLRGSPRRVERAVVEMVVLEVVVVVAVVVVLVRLQNC